MVRLWKDEHRDIVEGIKITRGTEPMINRIGARFFYRTGSRLSGDAAARVLRLQAFGQKTIH